MDLLESSLAPKRPIEGGLRIATGKMKRKLIHHCISVLVGKKNLEVRPLAVNKGEIVKRLMYENPEVDMIFCAGDDKVKPVFLFAPCLVH